VCGFLVFCGAPRQHEFLAASASTLTALAAEPQKKPPAEPLDLNSATVEQLEQLPGIGPVTAKDIVRFREKSGPFRRVEDLLAVHRITRRTLEKIRPYVVVRQKKRS
jgi:competence protein ComEA